MVRLDETTVTICVGGCDLRTLFGVDQEMTPVSVAMNEWGTLSITFKRKQRRWKAPHSNAVRWKQKAEELVP